ncbi:MAG: FAD:protein FMN transferase [Gammaproteobacteria bacterium]|nr:FAD:protein FMN transferase [Gammaproteobacteria bacterium]
MLRLILTILFAFFISACDLPGRDASHVHHTQFFSFGTVVEVTQFDSDEKRVKRIEEKVKEDFDYMHMAWHPYEPGPLARINSLLPFGSSFSIAPSVLPLIKRGTELAELSDGYFNPAMGGLLQLWGFDRSEDLDKAVPPDAEKIKSFVDNMPTMKDLELKGLSLAGHNKNLFLDFGGFAKGFGVDRAIEEIRKLGIENAIVNAGGDLRAIGSKDGKPWVIGIRHPRNKGVIASVSISGDESVFTSGDYERFFEFEGKRYHHILNPKTGYPGEDFQSVTTVHTNAALADAAATALFVAGKKDWQRIAKKMAVAQVMLIDQQGAVIITPELKARIKLHNVSPDQITVQAL